MNDILKPQGEPRPNYPEHAQGALTNTTDVALLPLKGYFNTENLSIDEEKALNWIYGFFDNVGTMTSVEMLLSLRAIERKLGMANVGESRIHRVHQYLKLHQQISELSSLKQSMEHAW